MKKLVCLILGTLLFSNSDSLFAQSSIFKSFKVYKGIEFAISTNDEASTGMELYISPINNIIDRFLGDKEDTSRVW